MTDILLDPNDTGEIPRPIGEETVRIVGENRARIDTGEATQRIDPDTIKMIVAAPSFTAIPRRQIDETTKIALPETIGVVDLDDKPHPKPPPLPAPPKHDPDTQRLTLLGAGAGVDGELRPADYVGRHRDPQDRHAIPGEAHRARMVEAARPAGEPRGVRLAVAGFVGFAALVTFTVLAVFW